jgi:hypothetical protein
MTTVVNTIIRMMVGGLAGSILGAIGGLAASLLGTAWGWQPRGDEALAGIFLIFFGSIMCAFVASLSAWLHRVGPWLGVVIPLFFFLASTEGQSKISPILWSSLVSLAAFGVLSGLAGRAIARALQPSAEPRDIQLPSGPVMP